MISACVSCISSLSSSSLFFDSVYVDLQYGEIAITFTAGSVSLCCVCSHVVVVGLSVRLSWYPMWKRWLL